MNGWQQTELRKFTLFPGEQGLQGGRQGVVIIATNPAPPPVPAVAQANDARSAKLAALLAQLEAAGIDINNVADFA